MRSVVLHSIVSKVRQSRTGLRIVIQYRISKVHFEIDVRLIIDILSNTIKPHWYILSFYRDIELDILIYTRRKINLHTDSQDRVVCMDLTLYDKGIDHLHLTWTSDDLLMGETPSVLT